MKAGAGAVLALVLAAGALRAQTAPQPFVIPSVEADPAIVARCLGQGGSGATCLGAMTEACREDNALGNENLEERLCVIEEYNTWRGLVAEEYRQLSASAALLPRSDWSAQFGDPALTLARARDAWQVWREAACRAEALLQAGSPRRETVADICLRDRTAERYDRLRALRRVLAGGGADASGAAGTDGRD